MPNVSVASLKKENDSLKDKIAFEQDLEELQQSIKRQHSQASNNGGKQASNDGGEQQPTHWITDAETLSTLEFYGKSYDEL